MRTLFQIQVDALSRSNAGMCDLAGTAMQ